MTAFVFQNTEPAITTETRMDFILELICSGDFLILGLIQGEGGSS